MSDYVEVYLRDDGRIFIQGTSEIIDGPSVGNGWVRVLQPDVSDQQLGQVVIEGLGQTVLGIPEVAREELAKLKRPLLKLAGVSSFTRFAVGTRMVGVKRDVAADVLTVWPTKNARRRPGGFLFMSDDQDIEVRSPLEDEPVGRAVRKGLQRALP